MSQFNVFGLVVFATWVPVLCFGSDHATKPINHILVRGPNVEFESKLGKIFLGSWEATEKTAAWCIDPQFVTFPIRSVCIEVAAKVKQLQFEVNAYINDRKAIAFTLKDIPENCFPIPLQLPLSGLGVCIEISELEINENHWHLCLNVHLTNKLDLIVIYLPCLDIPRLFGNNGMSMNETYMNTKSISVET